MRAGCTDLNRRRLTLNTGHLVLRRLVPPVWREALLQSNFKPPETFARGGGPSPFLWRSGVNRFKRRALDWIQIRQRAGSGLNRAG